MLPRLLLSLCAHLFLSINSCPRRGSPELSCTRASPSAPPGEVRLPRPGPGHCRSGRTVLKQPPSSWDSLGQTLRVCLVTDVVAVVPQWGWGRALGVPHLSCSRSPTPCADPNRKRPEVDSSPCSRMQGGQHRVLDEDAFLYHHVSSLSLLTAGELTSEGWD